jgi:hypothetical protein
VISFIALVVAISGTAFAASKIQSSDIANNAVTAKKIKAGAVKGGKIPDGALGTAKLKDGAVTSAKLAAGAVGAGNIAPGSITGAQIADKSISDAKLSNVDVFGNAFIRVTATAGADAATARSAAPEQVLFTKGQLTLYAKCYHDDGANQTFGYIYIRTSADGAIFDGSVDNKSGGDLVTDFLNTNTLETDREVDQENATGNNASYNESEYSAASPDGTALNGQLAIGAKNGTLTGGNGIYGDGNVCLFQGTALG